jgi:hypothetical protein
MSVVLPILEPAIVGSGEYLTRTPCHKQSIRLQEDEVTGDFTTVYCLRCSKLWEITFKKVGVKWMALWWPG